MSKHVLETVCDRKTYSLSLNIDVILAFREVNIFLTLTSYILKIIKIYNI
jgi:hypothetical protein